MISHGYNQSRPGYTRFQDALDWQGTDDPTAWLCIGEATGFLSGLVPGGLEGLMCRNHDWAVTARRMLCQRLPLRPICPEEMLGSMAASLLPEGAVTTPSPAPAGSSPVVQLCDPLLERFGIEVPVYYRPAAPQAILRISAQAYNALGQYERLAEALQVLLEN